MADQQLKISILAIDNATKALNDVKKSLQGITKQTEEVSTSFFTLSNIFKTFISVEVIRRTYSIISAFQDLKSSLNFATGSIEEGNKAFNFLNKFSEKSRFNIKDLSNAFVLLYRAGINPTTELLKTFTDTASATANPLQTLNALILLFTKATEGGMGLVQFKRLESEGILPFKILRKEFGLSKDAVELYLKSVEGTTYILDLLKQGLKKTFGGAEANSAKNLTASFGDLKNAGEKLIATFGDTGLNKVLVETFNLLKDLIDLIQNSDIGRGVGAIVSGISFGLGKIIDGIKEYKRARKEFNEAIGIGKSTKQPDAPEAPETIIKDTFPQTVYKELSNASDQLRLQFESINKTIAEGIVGGIKDVSKALAESIILGKDLQASFRDIAQNLLIKILTSLIEEQIIKVALLALDQFAVLLGLKKLSIERQITKEKLKQKGTEGTISEEGLAKEQLGNIFNELFERLKTSFSEVFDSISTIFGSISDYSSQIFNNIGGSLGDILGSLSSSIGNIFSSIGGSLGNILGSIGGMFGGGGGGFDLGSIFSIATSFFGFAEGGAVRGGMPITVGERGRELFIPNTSGTIVSNHDMAKTGSVVNINVSAVDVRGVEQLFLNNRAIITNIVNQALNSRGKSNLV
jgi:hypothetical protein